jgi:hypothetical protein
MGLKRDGTPKATKTTSAEAAGQATLLGDEGAPKGDE